MTPSSVRISNDRHSTRRGIIITGGSKGLGYAVAKRLARQRDALALCGRDTGRLRSAAAELRHESCAEVHTEALDVVDGDLEGFIERAANALGRVDGLVLCAGGASGGGLAESTSRDWQRTYELNVGHPARALRTCLPHLSASRGSALLISSISGWKPAPPAQYAAAKAAQLSLAASWARELGPQGVRVNALSPGSMCIPGGTWDRLRLNDPAAYETFQREFPGKELPGPDEIADVACFLLSEEAAAISGTNIPADRAQNAPTAFGY
ncbi:SDR family oxidoreductase [Saccharopolyspora sp. HNM0986]|uniref:SDR family NAD(P)-dependent oxidoreductase n=1 Tax=Saccharopolyspora galaxeae TaxID=2781241 RepID=UPI00190A3782|nr:SDR family oxidoreductase [Saccharopolyspora sp. HNM0986]MBK0870238.1 SDR family oxidoreductase [Saccharopolyspora sp. HNM0986]